MATSISKTAEVAKFGGLALGFRDIVKAEGGRSQTSDFGLCKSDNTI